MGEAYDDDGEEIVVDDDYVAEQEEVEENDGPWRHVNLPNPLGHHGPTAHKLDLRQNPGTTTQDGGQASRTEHNA